MAKELYHFEGTTCLGSIDSEHDLKPRSGNNINPPPANGRCMCCGRHLSELKPFGKAGDPLVGDFDGERLVKTWKRFYPRDEKRERLWDHYFGNCHTKEDFERQRRLYDDEFGTDAALNLELYLSASDQIEAVWLCRDCIILDDDEYFRKISRGWGQSKEQSEKAMEIALCADCKTLVNILSTEDGFDLPVCPECGNGHVVVERIPMECLYDEGEH